jgi:trimethylamine--corrinoid protein Co-methyltransferase
MSEVKPAIKVLTREQIDKIHTYSLEILSTTGIRIDSLRARKLFAKALGISGTDGIVRIPVELVEQALKAAPFVVYSNEVIRQARFFNEGIRKKIT